MDEDILRAGDDAYDRVQALLRTLDASVSGSSHPIDSASHESTRYNQQEAEDEQYYGRDGGLMARDLRAQFRATSNFTPAAEAPTLDIQEVMERGGEAVLRLEQESVWDDGNMNDEHIQMALCLYKEGAPVIWEVDTVGRFMECLRGKLLESGYFKQDQSKRVVRQTFDGERRVEMQNLVRVEEEMNTWRLLHMLHSSLESVDDDSMENTGEYLTTKVALDDLYVHDPILQLMNVVVRWFHMAMLDKRRVRVPFPGNNEDQAYGAYLPYTTKSLPGSGLTVIDPDATLRETDGKLNRDDLDDQITLLEHYWNLIRCGAAYWEFDESLAEELAQEMKAIGKEYGDVWRIASLTGGRPYQAKEVTKEFDGNAYRSVWKGVCQRLSRKAFQVAASKSEGSPEKRAAILEGTMYAVCASDLDGVLGSPLIESWQDRCWAHFRCVMDSRIDIMAITHRNHMISSFKYIPGPQQNMKETELYGRAELLIRDDVTTIFDKVRPKVQGLEKFFFEIQRALIQGEMSGLVQGEDPDDQETGLCEYLCGTNWKALPLQTISQFCGYGYIVDQLDAAEDVPKEALTEVETAPCWDLANRAFSIQLLRFCAYMTSYMRGANTLRSVVQEREPLVDEMVESIVLAYVLFLVQDSENMLQRYSYVPLFYPQFTKTGRDLVLAIQSAMMEITTNTPVQVREKLRETWSSKLQAQEGNMDSLLAQAARQTIRNIRREWKESDTPELIMKALHDVNEESDGRILNDLKYRLVESWSWLAFEETRTEALSQANTIVRDLVYDVFTSDDENVVMESMILVKHFLRTNVVEDFLKKSPASTPGELRMSSLPIKCIDREREGWQMFFNAHDIMEEWRDSMQWLVEQNFLEPPNMPPPSLYEEMYKKACQVADMIKNVLTPQDGGAWLLDPSSGDDMMDDDDSNPKNRLRPEFANDTFTDKEAMERTYTITELRKICIPYLINQYIDILFEAGAWIEKFDQPEAARSLYEQIFQEVPTLCVQPDIKQSFDQENMAHVLERLRQTKLQILKLT